MHLCKVISILEKGSPKVIIASQIQIAFTFTAPVDQNIDKNRFSDDSLKMNPNSRRRSDWVLEIPPSLGKYPEEKKVTQWEEPFAVLYSGPVCWTHQVQYNKWAKAIWLGRYPIKCTGQSLNGQSGQQKDWWGHLGQNGSNPNQDLERKGWANPWVNGILGISSGSNNFPKHPPWNQVWSLASTHLYQCLYLWGTESWPPETSRPVSVNIRPYVE